LVGLVAVNPTRPVGLAPELLLTGRVAAPGAVASLEATDPHGGHFAVALDPQNGFSIPATPGRWVLRASAEALGAIERVVVVRDAPVRLAALVLGADSPAPLGRQVTIDFESITKSWLAKIPSGVGGLDWDYLNAMEAVSGKGEGYVNGLGSGQYIGYSSSGHPVTVSRPGGFDFVGAYFTVAFPAAEGELLRVEARRGGRLVGEESIALSSRGPVWFDADYRGVDEIRFETARYWQLVVDDLAVRVPD
jgi:hypothetical protein